MLLSSYNSLGNLFLHVVGLPIRKQSLICYEKQLQAVSGLAWLDHLVLKSQNALHLYAMLKSGRRDQETFASWLNLEHVTVAHISSLKFRSQRRRT